MPVVAIIMASMRHSFPIALFLLLGSGLAHAQTYPSRPIRLVVPYAAGNTGDISIRAVGPSIEAKL
jgi:tripartite-type tricarboxylate transporter receptor subunit TctC